MCAKALKGQTEILSVWITGGCELTGAVLGTKLKAPERAAGVLNQCLSSPLSISVSTYMCKRVHTENMEEGVGSPDTVVTGISEPPCERQELTPNPQQAQPVLLTGGPPRQPPCLVLNTGPCAASALDSEAKGDPEVLSLLFLSAGIIDLCLHIWLTCVILVHK